jgi:hypothetical protein
MDLSSAWRKLGKDPNAVAASLSSLPRGDRVARAYQMLAEARQCAKKLMAANHPDRGGSPSEFRAISEALGVVESCTVEFEKKMREFVKDSELAASKRVLISLGSK